MMLRKVMYLLGLGKKREIKVVYTWTIRLKESKKLHAEVIARCSFNVYAPKVR